MASVFLSYDRDDVDRARPIALTLEKAGHSVWWDLHVRGGAQFSKVIEEALKAADAVVVLWSKQSVESAWVRDEAAAGRDSGRLIPVRLDSTEPPLGFRQFQTIDLSRWKGRGHSEQLRALLADVEALTPNSQVGRESPPPSAAPPVGRLTRRTIIVSDLMLAGLLVASLIAWRTMLQPSSVPLVAVRPTDQSPASEAMARDLLVKLGALQRARQDSIDFLSFDETATTPTLIFQVGRSAPGKRAEANLALTDTRNRSLLWAKDFRDPNGNEADLSQQLGYTAAHVLDCAIEGMDTSAGRLSRPALKIYLNACAPMPETSMADISASIGDLRRVVRDAPWFAGGWAKLLLAETGVATHPIGSEGKAIRPLLARHIVEARRLHPILAEAYIAEYELTPDWRFRARGRLLDEGIERNPDSPELRFTRHAFLGSVGRVEDSLADALRAMELDPLSPDKRHGYIMSLAFAGRMEEALAELEKAERLWPGVTSLRYARYTLHNRVGNPREALRLLRAGVLQNARTEWVRTQEALLEARIDRSPAKVEKAIRSAKETYQRIPQAISLLAQAFVELNREEELFPILLEWRRRDIVTWITEVLFRPGFSDFHKDPRFMQVAKQLGLLDYWRASDNWPDFCSRPDLPYDCKKEAAKLAA